MRCSDKLSLILAVILPLRLKSNPKQATKRLFVWWLLTFLCVVNAEGEPHTLPSHRFVSLSLCSDRLLSALALPEQIVAMSPYSTNPSFMLSAANTTKPTVRAELSELLPYIQSTILLNERFHPRLVQRLKKLGFSVVGINDNPQTPTELFQLIRQLAQLTGQVQKAENLIASLPLPTPLVSPNQATSVLLLSENGYLNIQSPQYRTLLNLMGYQSVNQTVNSQHQASALEDVLLTNPQTLIKVRTPSGYNDKGQWLNHPALTAFAEGRNVLELPTKYTYCFDHGVWQGANFLKAQ